VQRLGIGTGIMKIVANVVKEFIETKKHEEKNNTTSNGVSLV
jgi:hypothetical protein